ncbi:hypothetical protein ACHAXT_005010 [Thalassiosira profunda]
MSHASAAPLDGNATTNNEHDNTSTESFCATRGSLHQLALDQFNHSSPPGSTSYKKLKHVLDLNEEFFIDMGGKQGIFFKNTECMVRMLQGYGLRQITARPENIHNVTLVETIFTHSWCMTADEEKCLEQPRIIIQTEQYWKPQVLACHKSTNCAILDFSDFNYYKASQYSAVQNLEQSFVTLPVMTQSPSRMSAFLPAVPTDLQSRPIDMVFFGLITNRRQALTKGAAAYREAHPDRKVVVQMSHSTQHVASQYANSKVCLLAHSYGTLSGGEYHRISEFAPFGCIPVVEYFKDTVGIDVYQRCGGFVFEVLQNITSTAARVVAAIDRGEYKDRACDLANWWAAGIRWDEILPTVYGVRRANIAEGR